MTEGGGEEKNDPQNDVAYARMRKNQHVPLNVAHLSEKPDRVLDAAPTYGCFQHES
jgi:hypothetical protein